MTNINNDDIGAFAIVVDNEVAGVMYFRIGETMDALGAAALSNPTIVRRPEIVNFPGKGPMAFFDFYVDGELGPNIGYRTDMDNSAAIVAGLSSDPTIVQIDRSLNPNVDAGWTWDGTNFSAPQ